MSGKSVSVYAVRTYISSWFPYARCADVADANQDGRISSADSDAILDYYAYYLAGMTYNGRVGKTKYYID
jgi:hypothetical protein